MISFYLAHAASLFFMAFEKEYTLAAFALFCVFAFAFSLFHKKRTVPLPVALAGIIVAAYYIWFAFALLGVKDAGVFTVSAVIGGLFGRDGVRRGGDILFFIGLSFIVVSLFVKGETKDAAGVYFIPLAAFAGVFTASAAGKKPFPVVLSCVLGGIAGAAARYGGGVFGRAYFYAALFIVGASAVAFVISGFQKA